MEIRDAEGREGMRTLNTACFPKIKRLLMLVRENMRIRDGKRRGEGKIPLIVCKVDTKFVMLLLESVSWFCHC